MRVWLLLLTATRPRKQCERAVLSKTARRFDEGIKGKATSGGVAALRAQVRYRYNMSPQNREIAPYATTCCTISPVPIVYNQKRPQERAY